MNFILKVYASLPNLLEYMTYAWNWMDITMLGAFVLGAACRIAYDGDLARIFLAFSLFIFYVRLLERLTIFKSTGPKVLMIGRMVCFV